MSLDAILIAIGALSVAACIAVLLGLAEPVATGPVWHSARGW